MVLKPLKMKTATDKYRWCNHHHEIGDNHKLVDFGDGQFVANKEAIPLLKALNEVGLRTRSHHIDENENAWVCILLDNVDVEIKNVHEKDADRTKYNGKQELLITWNRPVAPGKTKPKYNLTFWQRLELIPMRLFWLVHPPEDRKTWHEVKKGMEQHKHKFTKPIVEQGYKFLQCEHEGCTLCEPD
jgi:hypothetical protein